MSQKTGRGDALRKKALLHTFVAGQKYGVGRDETRRFCLSKMQQEQQLTSIMKSAELCQRPERSAAFRLTSFGGVM